MCLILYGTSTVVFSSRVTDQNHQGNLPGSLSKVPFLESVKIMVWFYCLCSWVIKGLLVWIRTTEVCTHCRVRPSLSLRIAMVQYSMFSKASGIKMYEQSKPYSVHPLYGQICSTHTLCIHDQNPVPLSLMGFGLHSLCIWKSMCYIGATHLLMAQTLELVFLICTSGKRP